MEVNLRAFVQVKLKVYLEDLSQGDPKENLEVVLENPPRPFASGHVETNRPLLRS